MELNLHAVLKWLRKQAVLSIKSSKGTKLKHVQVFQGQHNYDETLPKRQSFTEIQWQKDKPKFKSCLTLNVY